MKKIRCCKKLKIRLFLFFYLGIISFLFSSAHAEIYKWKDSQGKTHLTDDISRIPRAYRKSVDSIPETVEKKMTPHLPKNTMNQPPEKGQGLGWPIQCTPGINCSLGFPDVDNDGRTPYGKNPAYPGHEGTDIQVSWEQMDRGVQVYAAADGIVQFVFDDPGRFDRCQPGEGHKDCQAPHGTDVTTGSGNYCKTGDQKHGQCSWIFGGGNVVILLHPQIKNVFATRYDHFKSGSIAVKAGQKIKKGQLLGFVGSSGRSTGPHLHFEVWGPGGYYTHGPVVDPWDGSRVPGQPGPLWANKPPWKQ